MPGGDLIEFNQTGIDSRLLLLITYLFTYTVSYTQYTKTVCACAQTLKLYAKVGVVFLQALYYYKTQR